ncbi:GFA family protein [Pseudohalioglobus sediminis]|uniref:GFA family protein n=1 Tax=Pseudohalioglobus sediminis TaxID=2606449 RepID=A0A5B0X4M8_9GAMM|nr:GFA family protein [Pseudohalioglobus sediminis]KAA1194350.1 GFA family protein [Pseudohalioglobus sediminis]
MTRTAQCSCGALQITTDGDPEITMACNCTNCQRRTGSAFGVVAYFERSKVLARRGEGRQFTHLSDSKRRLERTFCPHCGSTVHWQAELFPGMIGVAVGCFNEQDFPAPNIAAWHNSKLDWVEFPCDWMRLPEQDPGQALAEGAEDPVAAREPVSC